MVDTNGYHVAWAEEMEKARFSLLAAEFLAEEISEKLTFDQLKDLRTRHRKHIREANKHTNRAEKIRRKAERIEKKERKADGRIRRRSSAQ